MRHVLNTLPTLRAALVVALLAGSACLAYAGAGPAPPPAPGARASLPARPSKASLTLLYGDDHCFGIVCPAGWSIDDTSGLGSKIRVVLYPSGQKWTTAQTVMYVNPVHQPRSQPRTLAQVIDQDAAAFQKQAPRGKVTVASPVRTGKGKTAQVRYFAREGHSPEEAVAYVEEPNLIMLLVLSSREPGGFQRSLPAFRDMVSSYQFVAGNIRTPTSR